MKSNFLSVKIRKHKSSGGIVMHCVYGVQGAHAAEIRDEAMCQGVLRSTLTRREAGRDPVHVEVTCGRELCNMKELCSVISSRNTFIAG